MKCLTSAQSGNQRALWGCPRGVSFTRRLSRRLGYLVLSAGESINCVFLAFGKRTGAAVKTADPHCIPPSRKLISAPEIPWILEWLGKLSLLPKEYVCASMLAKPAACPRRRLVHVANHAQAGRQLFTVSMGYEHVRWTRFSMCRRASVATIFEGVMQRGRPVRKITALVWIAADRCYCTYSCTLIVAVGQW